MKLRIPTIILIAIIAVGVIFSVFNDMKKYNKFVLEEAKNSSTNISWYFENVFSTLSNLKVVEFPSATSTLIKGYSLMNLEGQSLYDFNISDDLFSKNSDAYRYALSNGRYISPFFKSPGDSPFVILSAKSSDGKYISIAKVDVKIIGMADSFLVDKTGLGISIDGPSECKNFLSVVALGKKGVILKDGMLFFIEPVGVGGYEVLVAKPFWLTLLNVSRNDLYIWLLAFLSLLIAINVVNYKSLKKMGSLVRFSKFLNGLDSFKRYEEDPQSEIGFKYNSLVDKHEKLDKDYSELIRDISETNTELVELNKLLIEFSMLFNEVKMERKSLEEALKMAFRRMLDFSKPITGIGMKYKDFEVYLGTVNAFNFDTSGSGKMALEVKTDSAIVKYVISFDRFTINERTKEMIRTLLYHLTTFLTMHEFLERSKNSMKYDPLTGLLTRQEFEELMKREEALAKRENKYLSFLMIDIKKLRKFNEKYGKLNGDVLLKFVAKIISENVRLTDITSRYGEDEFVICFYAMKKEDAIRKSTQIVSQIHNFKYEVEVKYALLTYPTDGDNISKIVLKLEKQLGSLD